jgi:hypothetical protein
MNDDVTFMRQAIRIGTLLSRNPDRLAHEGDIIIHERFDILSGSAARQCYLGSTRSGGSVGVTRAPTAVAASCVLAVLSASAFCVGIHHSKNPEMSAPDTISMAPRKDLPARM